MIRQNATEQSPISWLYKDQLIEVVFFDKRFHIRCRPPGMNMETILWPVPSYNDKKKTSKAINKLIGKACQAINRNEYLTPRRVPFTLDKKFLAYLQSLGNADYDEYIQYWELTGIIESQKKQLSIFFS